MKKIYMFLLIPIAFGALIIFMSNTEYSSMSPGGKTGSIGDGETTCVQCHSGSSVLFKDGWITSDIPSEGYIPGETYEITVSGTHSGVDKFGFEFTAEDQVGTKVGTITVINSTETTLVNNQKAISHTSAGNTPSGDSKSWTFNWTAPETNVGEILFYAAFNAANGNGSTSGDQIYRTITSVMPNTVAIDEVISSSIKMYPNPATSFVKIELPESLEINGMEVYTSANQRVLLNKSFESKIELDISDLPKGMYFVKLLGPDKEYSKKLLVY